MYNPHNIMQKSSCHKVSPYSYCIHPPASLCCLFLSFANERMQTEKGVDAKIYCILLFVHKEPTDSQNRFTESQNGRGCKGPLWVI